MGDDYAHIVGNGSCHLEGDSVAQSGSGSNCHTLKWDGTAWYAGDIYVGSTGGKNQDDGSHKVATGDFVTNHLATQQYLRFQVVTSSTLPGTQEEGVLYIVTD
jgi:hypothetical protein